MPERHLHVCFLAFAASRGCLAMFNQCQRSQHVVEQEIKATAHPRTLINKCTKTEMLRAQFLVSGYKQVTSTSVTHVSCRKEISQGENMNRTNNFCYYWVRWSQVVFVSPSTWLKPQRNWKCCQCIPRAFHCSQKHPLSYISRPSIACAVLPLRSDERIR